MRYWIRCIFYIVPACGAGLLSQCAHKEVKRQLDASVQTRGQNFARELQAQSPFEKVSLTWNDATELMKERNPEYREAVATQIEAESKSGAVKNFTFEVKQSLANTATQTLNPKEIAKALNNPVAELPKQLSSLTDLKNISHSLEQQEWERVGQAVEAQKKTRKELVKLHVLFRQEKVIEEHKALLDKYEKRVEGKPKLVSLLKKKRSKYEEQRKVWLNSVRDFFNAEYYDVDFKDSGKSLTLYRKVTDPEFHQWERWRSLGRSEEIAAQLCKQHEENKPTVPGINSLKSSLGIQQFQSNLALSGEKQAVLRSEVRTMLKKWRELKNAQAKITALKAKLAEGPSPEEITPQLIEEEFKVYEFLQLEIKLVSYFWMLDEECWS